MPKAKREGNGHHDSVLGHVIPRRRFTRWALYYFLLYCLLPVLGVGVLIYAVFTGLFGR